MPNIIDRITGNLTEAEEEDNIGLHAFLGAVNEWGRGKITKSEVVAGFSLTTQQEAQITALAALWGASPDKTRFMRVFKDLMYLGESNTHSRYRDITYIQTRLEEEVTDQGGTLP